MPTRTRTLRAAMGCTTLAMGLPSVLLLFIAVFTRADPPEAVAGRAAAQPPPDGSWACELLVRAAPASAYAEGPPAGPGSPPELSYQPEQGPVSGPAELHLWVPGRTGGPRVEPLELGVPTPIPTCPARAG
jgi:hypothetical protein